MKDFTIESFVAHLATLPVALEIEENRALERAAVIVEAEAVHEIGTYQDEAQPFVPWAELADSTKDQRVALGYTENDPGLRSGEMRASIEHTVTRGPGEKEAHVGSDDDKMVWFELGTEKQPPRSVLGGAMVRKTDEVLEVLGEGFVSALIGEGVVGGSLQIRGHDHN
jgi:hypothetical protein